MPGDRRTKTPSHIRATIRSKSARSYMQPVPCIKMPALQPNVAMAKAAWSAPRHPRRLWDRRCPLYCDHWLAMAPPPHGGSPPFRRVGVGHEADHRTVRGQAVLAIAVANTPRSSQDKCDLSTTQVGYSAFSTLLTASP